MIVVVTGASVGVGCATALEAPGKRQYRNSGAPWQPDLEMSLRSLARDYDETAEDLEVGASEIRHPELLPEQEN